MKNPLSYPARAMAYALAIAAVCALNLNLILALASAVVLGVVIEFAMHWLELN
jgi:hypothetical protein